jgi:NAD(P)-dependent dehydrogenase (short-subunit alcohol dehydrogenase family)
MNELKQQVAIITGAARGIGRAIAVRYAQAGADIAVCDMNMAGAEETAALCRAEGVRALAAQTDVAAKAEVEAFIGQVATVLGNPTVLVNNAGIFFNAPFETQTEEMWDRIMTINVKSVFLMSQAVIKLWLAQDIAGTIVNLASISASVAFVNSSAYCTTKAAVASLTRCIALEYGPRGIRCNSMAPGIIDTAMLPSAEDSNRWAREKLPLRRLGTPDDVADVALFLASAQSRYVTGDMIYVDGGWMLE